MADLNRLLVNVSQKTAHLREEFLSLLREYEGLYGESNNLYMTEKMASNNDGLDDFYVLVQTIRRNRDIVGSVLKGLNGIRPTDRFKFVEEEIIAKKIEKKEKEKKEEKLKQKKIKKYIEVPLIPAVESAPVNLQNTKEPEVKNG